MLNDTKLLLLIHHLDTKERKELHLWLKSPIHNSSENALKLYELIRKKQLRNPDTIIQLYQVVNLLGLTISTKSKTVSPKQKQEYRKIASHLTFQIQEYLTWKQFENRQSLKNRLLMDSLLEKRLFKINSALINKTKKIHQQTQLLDIKHCKDEFSIAEMEFYMDIILRNRKSAGSMKKVIQSLRISCICQLLRYYCALSNFKNLLTLETEFPFKAVLKNYLESSDDLQHFTVNIYYKLLVLLDNGQRDDYFQFKELLFNSLEAFDSNELRQFFSFMSNYCHRMIWEGDRRFWEERFILYESGINLSCWTAGVYFSQHHFIQIIDTCLELGKINWGKEFMDNYQGQLAPKAARNTILYCNSKLAFHEKQFDLSQQYLSQINTTEDFIQKLSLKVLLLKIYYDNNTLDQIHFDTHPINNELEALHVNTLRGSGKKIAERNRMTFSNFSLLLKRILTVRRKQVFRQSISNKELLQLNNQLSSLKRLVSRKWLQQKIDELGRD